MMRGFNRAGLATIVQAALGVFAPKPYQPRLVTSDRYAKGFQRSRHTAAQEKRAALKVRNKKRNRK